jgi:quinol monooxygenase YgiN
MSDFFLLAVLYARSGEEDKLRADLTAVVEPSRAEEGNLRYELFVSQDDPRRFVFLEHWASPAAREKHHTTSAHILHFQSQGVSSVEKLEIFKLDQIG